MNVAELLPPCESVPAGTFLMGTPDAERSGLAKRYGGTRESYADESPQHEVHVPAFAMTRAPVTNQLYAAFVEVSSALRPVSWRSGAFPPGLADHPIVDISWHDAVAFARWLSRVTGQFWALPTEAQWEKAARGDDGRQFPWGNSFDAARCNVRESACGGTTPVGSYPAGVSPYGLLDMAGNVWEWTRSLQAPYPYAGDGRDCLDPPRAARGMLTRIAERFRPRKGEPPQETRRVLRGGCYANPEGFARCACRFRLAPTSHTPLLGFRLVREV